MGTMNQLIVSYYSIVYSTSITINFRFIFLLVHIPVFSSEYCDISCSPNIVPTNTQYSTSSIPTTGYNTITVTASNSVQDVSNTQTGIILYC